MPSLVAQFEIGIGRNADPLWVADFKTTFKSQAPEGVNLTLDDNLALYHAHIPETELNRLIAGQHRTEPVSQEEGEDYLKHFLDLLIQSESLPSTATSDSLPVGVVGLRYIRQHRKLGQRLAVRVKPIATTDYPEGYPLDEEKSVVATSFGLVPAPHFIELGWVIDPRPIRNRKFLTRLGTLINTEMELSHLGLIVPKDNSVAS